MTTFDDDARRAAREVAREMRAAEPAAAHLTPDQILAYRRGDLPAPEVQKVQAHLALCPHCADGVLLSLHAQLAPPARPLPVAVRVAYGFAAGLLLAVLGLGLWNLGLRSRVSALEVRSAGQAQELAELRGNGDGDRLSGSAFLAPLRSAEQLRAAAEPLQVVAPPVGFRFVVFILAVGDELEGPAFRVELRRADGEVAWSEDGLSRASTGTVSWVVPKDSLPAGPYVVHLFAAQEGEVARYPVRYEPPS